MVAWTGANSTLPRTKMFYNDLPHPPVSAVGNNTKYRSADGSGNNVVLPNLGRSGQPYAVRKFLPLKLVRILILVRSQRSVPPVRPK